MLNLAQKEEDLHSFNDLTEAAAAVYIQQAESVLRLRCGACAYCADTLQLKAREEITYFGEGAAEFCILCNFVYVHGYPSSTVVKRSRGKEVTAADIDTFYTHLADVRQKVENAIAVHAELAGAGGTAKTADDIFDEWMTAWLNSGTLRWTRADGLKQTMLPATSASSPAPIT